MICLSRRCRPQPVLRAGLRSDITLNTRFPTSPSRTYKIGTTQYLERVATFPASVRVGTQINRGTVMEVRFRQTPDCQVANDPGPRMLNLCLVTHNRFAPAFHSALIVRAVTVSTPAKRSVCQRRGYVLFAGFLELMEHPTLALPMSTIDLKFFHPDEADGFYNASN